MKQFFDPIDFSRLHVMCDKGIDCLANQIDCYRDGGEFPNLQSAKLVLFGVAEDRRAVQNKGCADAANGIREKLYALAAPQKDMRICDLGNIVAGATVEDTYVAVSQVVSELIALDKTLIIIGGSQDVTYGVYQGYALQSRVMNIVSVDSRFDVADGGEINSHNWLKHIVMQRTNYLFQLTNLGYQTYFVGQGQVELMRELRFMARRLGEVQADLRLAEPEMRNADVVTVDMGAVRQSDAPGNGNPSPHGFYGEQLCQMMRYAGMSDKAQVLALGEVNPVYDRDGQTAHLAAHAIWFFVEGFYARKQDFPHRDKQNYKRYVVQVEELESPILFYKSKLSDRWWMEVPCEDEERRSRYGDHLLIPCTYADYEQAMKNIIPDNWMLHYHWINDPF